MSRFESLLSNMDLICIIKLWCLQLAEALKLKYNQLSKSCGYVRYKTNGNHEVKWEKKSLAYKVSIATHPICE